MTPPHSLVGCTQTNSRRSVALCGCGWASEAFSAVVGQTPTGRPRYNDEEAERKAIVAFNAHTRSAKVDA